jgi:hypothetical protein
VPLFMQFIIGIVMQLDFTVRCAECSENYHYTKLIVLIGIQHFISGQEPSHTCGCSGLQQHRTLRFCGFFYCLSAGYHRRDWNWLDFYAYGFFMCSSPWSFRRRLQCRAQVAKKIYETLISMMINDDSNPRTI